MRPSASLPSFKPLMTAFVIAIASLALGCGASESNGPNGGAQADANEEALADGASGAEAAHQDASEGSASTDASGDEGSTDASGDEAGAEDTTGPMAPDATEPDDEAEPIGEEMGEAQAIDHATVKAAIEAHLTAHIDGIDEALNMLETSSALTNLFEILIGGDDEDEGEGDDEGEASEEDSIIEIDLTGFRADLLEWIFEHVVHASTATLSEDGKALTYPVTAELFCAEEVELEDWRSEEEQARELERVAEDEAKCAQQLEDSPLSLSVTSDGEERLHLTMVAGLDETMVFAIQLHEDMIAGFVHLAGIKALLQTFIDKEDFEFPDTMTGTLGVEVLNEAALHYALRFSIEEALVMAGSQGQDTLALNLAATPSPGELTIDGQGGTITGQADIGALSAGVPWEMVVDLTWDSEGSSEWVCVSDEETGSEDCWEEWVDGPEAPEVSGMAHLTIAQIVGGLEVSAESETFALTDVSLGDSKIAIDKDGSSLVEVELNPNDAWTFGLALIGEDDMSTRIEVTPKLEARVVLSMDHVSDSFQDLPDFMAADTMGATMAGDAPSMTLMRDEDDEVSIQVSSGQLTLWSDTMDDDVVISAGQCIQHDDEGLSDEEKEALHDLFGGLYGGSCE